MTRIWRKIFSESTFLPNVIKNNLNKTIDGYDVIIFTYK